MIVELLPRTLTIRSVITIIAMHFAVLVMVYSFLVGRSVELWALLILVLIHLAMLRSGGIGWVFPLLVWTI